MRRSYWSVAGYLLLVFASGIGVGVFGHWMYAAKEVMSAIQPPPPRPSEDYRQRYLREMETRLKLTPDQLVKLNTILDGTRARFQEVNAKFRPEFKAIHQDQVAKVRAILTDAQKPEYELIMKERDERMKNMRKRGSKPGPGGGF